MDITCFKKEHRNGIVTNLPLTPPKLILIFNLNTSLEGWE